MEINPRNKKDIPDSFLYIDLESVKQGELVKHVISDKKGAPSRAQRLLEEGDILYSCVRPYQHNNYLFADSQIAVASTGFACLRGAECPEFLYQLLNTDRFTNAVLERCTGTSYPAINSSDLSSIKVMVPSKNEQLAIGTLIGLIDSKITVQNKIIEGFQRQKKILRNAVFSNVRGAERPISEIVAYEQPSRYIVSSDDYSADASLTPVLTANKGFILGYTADKKGIYHRGDAVILDDFTLDMKYVDFPFKVKSSAIKILTCNDKSTLRYVYEYLCYLNLNSSEHKRHYISEIAPMKIVLPAAKAIETIACLFEKMDQRVVREQKIQELLVSQKQYLLSAMFI